MQLVTVIKSNLQIWEDQNIFWGHIHKLRVNGHPIGKVITFGVGGMYHFLWGHYQLRVALEHFVKFTKTS